MRKLLPFLLALALVVPLSAQVTINGAMSLPQLAVGGQPYPQTKQYVANTATRPTDPFDVLTLYISADSTPFHIGGLNLTYSQSLNSGWGIQQLDNGDVTFGAGASVFNASPASDQFTFTALGSTLENLRIRPGTASNVVTIDSTTSAAVDFDMAITVNSCTGCVAPEELARIAQLEQEVAVLKAQLSQLLSQLARQ